MRSGLKVVVRRMLLAAVGMILGGVAEGGQTAAIKPQDLVRVKEIAAMLRPEAGFAETRMEGVSFFPRKVEPHGLWIKRVQDHFTVLRSLLLAECAENEGRFLSRIQETLDAISAIRTWTGYYHDRKGISYRGVGHVLDLGSGMHSEQVAIVLDGPVGSAVVEVTWAMKGEQGCK